MWTSKRPSPVFATRCLLLVCASLVLPGCMGDTSMAANARRQGEGGRGGETQTPGSPADGRSPVPGEPSLTCTEEALGGSPRPLRRLTRLEYDSTLRDLLGEQGAPSSAFYPDEVSAGFASNALAPLSRVAVEQYQAAAEKVAANATAFLQRAGCESAADPSGCVRAFIQSFAARAFRGPLTPEDVDALFALYQAKRQASDVLSGLRLVVEAVLQSPRFLYHVEVGTPADGRPGEFALTGPELAARLSYFLWATLPDAPLEAAAAAGELATAEGVELHARRMLNDARSRATLQAFHQQWLGIARDTVSKDATAFPEFDAAAWRSAREETLRFVEDVFGGAEGRLDVLLTANHSFVDATMARLYGLPAPGGTGFSRTTFPEGQRSGVLTQGSVLAAWAKADQVSPVARGLFIRSALLCHELPPPPPGVSVALPPVDPNLTTRERFAAHRADPACAGCHTFLDPVGLGFSHYDAIGRFITTEAGKPVDGSGELTGTKDVDGRFYGAPELGKRLAGSQQVQECMARQWFRYAMGRHETAEDACTVQRLTQRLQAAEGRIPELLVALTASGAFRFLKVE